VVGSRGLEPRTTRL